MGRKRLSFDPITSIQKRILNVLEDKKLDLSIGFLLFRGLRLVDNGQESLCWIRGLDSEQYTKINKVPAHKVSYELFKGKKLHHNGCHHCDKPACINPDHIFDGTDSKNHWDSVLKGRQSHYVTNR